VMRSNGSSRSVVNDCSKRFFRFHTVVFKQGDSEVESNDLNFSFSRSNFDEIVQRESTIYKLISGVCFIHIGDPCKN